MEGQTSRWRVPLVCLGLLLATAAVYGQVLGFEFVRFDDPKYVTKNPFVQKGITADGIAWAFRSTMVSNWHPITWISHMLDIEIYGLQPAGHHATSLLLHLLNAALLFGLLTSMTQKTMESALVAALFALHPLHVESVAWIAERKDVLSTTFGLLSACAYVNYTRRGGSGRYLLTAVLFALGLMTKPMVVTLPLLFLLFDYWPLCRDRLGAGLSWIRLAVEKIPLLLLSAASSVVTYLAQSEHGSVASAEIVPIDLRLVNAVVAYGWYLLKMVWPSKLAVLYPHPNLPGGTPWSAWQIAAATLSLVLISVVVLRTRRRYLQAGWLWYIGTLVPAIGLVQVGHQAMADRYTYLPLTGVFIMVVWGGGEAISRLGLAEGRRRAAMWGLALLMLGGCAITTSLQLRYWRTPRTLIEHALAVDRRNPMMLYSMGNIMVSAGRFEDAADYFAEAVHVRPNYAEASYNRGAALYNLGRYEEAIASFRHAVAVAPGYARAHLGLGAALQKIGRSDEAERHLREARRLSDGPRLEKASR